MYKLHLHPRFKPNEEQKIKVVSLLHKYLYNNPKIGQEFYQERSIDPMSDPSSGNRTLWGSRFHYSTDLSNPDILVQRGFPYFRSDTREAHAVVIDHCAFNFKFGMELINSIDLGLLKYELNRMKLRYTESVPSMAGGFRQKTTIPLYLIIVNEIPHDSLRFVIDQDHLMKAVDIVFDLNIRPIYCYHEKIFAKKVFSFIHNI